MSFNQSDVILLLSGGNGNVYSSQSIGGAYSNSQVNLNLFDINIFFLIFIQLKIQNLLMKRNSFIWIKEVK